MRVAKGEKLLDYLEVSNRDRQLEVEPKFDSDNELAIIIYDEDIPYDMDSLSYYLTRGQAYELYNHLKGVLGL